jgi:hypothetical protein
MKKISQKFFKSISPLAVLLAPMAVKAANEVQNGMSGLTSVFPQTGLGRVTTLTGPGGLIAMVIKILLLIAGAIAVLFVVYGGYQYLTSAGNAEAAEKGKNTVVNALIGIIIIILAYVIINVIVNMVSGNGWF